jgi:hypothetical protein
MAQLDECVAHLIPKSRVSVSVTAPPRAARSKVVDAGELLRELDLVSMIEDDHRDAEPNLLCQCREVRDIGHWLEHEVRIEDTLRRPSVVEAQRLGMADESADVRVVDARLETNTVVKCPS